MIYIASYFSPLGEITLACDGENLTGVWFREQKYYPLFDKDVRADSHNRMLINASKWLDSYFAGEKPDSYELSLSPTGSNFRKIIWDILRDIPYGKTTTYGEIARNASVKLGVERMSSQAVGGAIAHNPISIIIPCHRVIGKNGSLTGYAGGTDKKYKLLSFEGADVSFIHQDEKNL